MKKSRFNIIRKIDEDIHIIFNSFSLAIAKIDKDFFKIYNNVENIDVNTLADNDKQTFNSMIEANFIVDNECNELKNLEFFRLNQIINIKSLGLTIYPTLACNFDCYYCYEKNKTGVMTDKVQEKILELIRYHAERKSDIQIEWIGGEPLLKFDIIYDLSKKIMDVCKKNNVKYSAHILTNGYLFTDDIITKIKECNIEFVQVTLDGPPEIHNKRRFLKNTKNGTFNKILENTKKLKENKINVSIRVNVNKDFNDETLMKLTKILEKNNLKDDFHIANEFNPDSNKRSCYDDNCFSDEAFAKFNLDFCKKLHNLGIIELDKNYYPKLILNFCLATKSNSLEIDPEGYLYKCHRDVSVKEKAIGNILDSSYNEKFFNNNVKYMTWNPFSFNKCTECNIIPICGGNCPEIGLAKNEPQCINWKYNIEDLIDAIALFKSKE